MENILDICEERNKKCVVIVDDEDSVMAQIIKDSLINQLKHQKLDYTILQTNKIDGSFLIDEYKLTEFPCVLYFKNQKLIQKVSGFCYQDYYNILAA